MVGFAGLLDLGYAAFFAIGAYAYGIFSSYQVQPEWWGFWEPFQWLGLVAAHPAVRGGPGTVHFTVSFWLMLPISALIAAFFGVMFGAPTLRLQGRLSRHRDARLRRDRADRRAQHALSHERRRGPERRRLAAPLRLFASASSRRPSTISALRSSALLIFVSLRLKNSRIGRAWMAIREDEIAAEAMGVNRVKLKLLAFAIGAGFAGTTGTFYVAKLQTATPEMFTFPVSVMMLVMIVLGGMGSVAGVVLGALILQLLQSWFLQDLTQWIHALGRLTGIEFFKQLDLVQSIELIFGIILVVMMLFRRQGLIPERAAVTALTHAQQTAVPSRGGVEGALAPLHRRTIDPKQAAARDPWPCQILRRHQPCSELDLDVDARLDRRHHRAERLGQDDLLQPHHRPRRSPTAARCCSLGEDVTGLPPHVIVERGIARTFQNLRLFANMTLLENVLVGMHARTTTGAIGAVLRTPRRPARGSGGARARARDRCASSAIA